MFDDLSKLREREPRVYGLEYLVDGLLLICRRLSLSYWIRRPFEHPLNLRQRTWVIDLYCFMELAILFGFLVWSDNRGLSTVVSGYILFEIYLSLFNIVFIGKFPKINYAPPSIERVILLMFVNVLQVIIAFAILYRSWSSSILSWPDAFSQAVRVLGTVEAPAQPRFMVDMQILLDLLLLVIFLASCVGQVGVFRRTPGTEKESQTSR